MLARRARAIISARHPEVIAITGSVGKTSAKEAIAAVLAKKFDLRSSYKNYNNEIGLPLTIIGEPSPGRSLSGWQQILTKAKRLASDPKLSYPQALVLEMGIDHPGDMAYLAEIARPTRAVITRLGTAHAEFFSSVNALHEEKLSLLGFLGENGYFIYNDEDEKLRSFARDCKIKTISYGFGPNADVRADQLRTIITPSNGEGGATFKLSYEGSVVPVHSRGLISRPAVLSALAGAAVGFSYGLNAIEISEALATLKSVPGRMNLVAGQQSTLIIDDTYNASPEAVAEGLATVSEIDRADINRRWVVLGDMRELGKESVTAHERIGKMVAEYKFDKLIVVGSEARHIALGARAAGMDSEHISEFSDSVTAAAFLEKNIASRDVIFVKGSQAVRMEKIVKRIMKDPEQAEELLVRQSKEWQ